MTISGQPIGAAIRAVLTIAIAGIVTLKGREWLLHGWGISVPPVAYLVIGYLFMGMVIWLTMRPLLRDLRAAPRAVHFHEEANTAAIKEFRFRRVLCYSVALVAVFWVAVPLVSRTTLMGYLLFFGAAVLTALPATYCFRFRLKIGPNTIQLRGFLEREYAPSDVTGAEVVRAKGGPVLVVTFSNGERLRLSSMLTHFSTLVSVFKAMPRNESR